MIKLTETVKHLIIINVLVFLATIAFKEQIYDLLAMHFPKNPLFKPWQIITHMFMHSNFNSAGNINIMHILFNMLGLWMFGSVVENMLGRNKFLILFFLSGFGAVILHVGIQYIQFTYSFNEFVNIGLSKTYLIDFIGNNEKLNYYPTIIGEENAAKFINMHLIYMSSAVGASGALYGIIIAYGVLFPRGKMGLLFLPIMIEARIFIPLLLLYDMFFGIFSIKGDSTAHFAHIGGAITGFLLIWSLKKHHFKRWF